MAEENANEPATLADALAYLRRALQVLDSLDAPAQIGAHIDLAIHQLETQIAGGSAAELHQLHRSVGGH